MRVKEGPFCYLCTLAFLKSPAGMSFSETELGASIPSYCHPSEGWMIQILPFVEAIKFLYLFPGVCSKFI